MCVDAMWGGRSRQVLFGAVTVRSIHTHVGWYLGSVYGTELQTLVVTLNLCEMTGNEVVISTGRGGGGRGGHPHNCCELQFENAYV